MVVLCARYGVDVSVNAEGGFDVLKETAGTGPGELVGIAGAWLVGYHHQPGGSSETLSWFEK